jgi:hypothetical protein
MTRHPTRPLAVAAAFACAASTTVSGGCELFASPELEPTCPAASRVQVDANVLESQPVRGNATIRGTAHQPDGLALRSVSVAGIPATSTAPDFASFEVLVPFAVLTSERGDEGTAKLQILIEDSCGTVNKAGTVEVAVLDSSLSGLAVDIVPSLAGAGFLPTSVTAPALVEVRTAEGGEGALVHLAVTGGRFLTPGDDDGADEIDVTLFSSGDEGSASAQAVLVADQDGLAQVLATGGGEQAEDSIPAAGPPVVSPFAASLSDDEQLGVTVQSRAGTLFCRADVDPADAEITVVGVAGGEAVGATERSLDVPAAGLQLLVTAGDVDADDSITLTCRDGYGQTASATFSGTGP